MLRLATKRVGTQVFSMCLLLSSAVGGAQVQPVRPRPANIARGFDVATPSGAHTGTDYDSMLGTPITSVGPGGTIIGSYTRPDAQGFGALEPKGKTLGRGPAIWVKYTLVNGDPIYVLYGHTATSWSDYSTGVGTAQFTFDATYQIHWKPNDPIGAFTVIGETAPYYYGASFAAHLHLGVFKPSRACSNNSFCPPPGSGWGYGPIHTAQGDFIDPEQFFTDPQYELQSSQTTAGPTAHFTMSAPGLTAVSDPGTLTATVTAGASVGVTFTSTSTAGSANISNYLWKSNGTQFCTTNPCTAPFSTPSNSITLTVTDQNGNVSSASGLVLVNQQVPTLAITTTALSPSTATVGAAYSSQAMTATGGTTPYGWSLPSGPSWLSMNPTTGILSGTPPSGTATGTVNLAVGIHDSASSPQSTSKPLSLTLNPVASATLAITATALSPSTATMGTAYSSQAMTATGGTTPYTWSISGAPNGVTMNPMTGVLSGTPTGSGTFSLMIGIHDSSSPQQTISKAFPLTVNPAVVALSITSTGLSPAMATDGTAYTAAAMTASGGAPPYTWSVSGQPSGLSMNPTSGVLSGTPTATGTFNLTVGVHDNNSPQRTASQGFTLTVSPQQTTGPTAAFTMAASGVSPVSAPGTLTVSAAAGSSASVNFTSTSTQGSSAIVSYIWKSNGVQICVGSTTTCTVGFTTPNTSTITLTVTDNNGKTSSPAQGTLVVNAATPIITKVSPNPLPALSGMQPFTITGVNLPANTSAGYILFTDPALVTHPSTAYPARVLSTSATQWVYNIDDNGTNGAGPWTVQMIDYSGQASAHYPFTVK